MRRCRSCASSRSGRPSSAGRRASAFPAGESFLELQSRLTDTVEKICRAHPGEVVVAVSHADCIKAVLASALGVPLDLFQRIVVAPCSISTVVYGPDGPPVQAMGATYGSAGVSPTPETAR